MNRCFTLLIALLLTLSAAAQNAPVTRAALVTDADTNGTVVVPVTVTGFSGIGGFTLTLRYRSDKATYTGFTPNTAFTGLTVTHTVSGTIGKLVIFWPQTAGGVTLPDGAALVTLSFTYLAGTTGLSWSYSSGNICQYYLYSGGGFVLAGDNPKTSYYINGGISNRAAPVTTAAVVPGATSGSSVSVPVTVTGFTLMGSLYLTLEFDSTVLTFQSFTANSAFGGALSYGVAKATGVYKRITAGWYGDTLDLPDGSALFTVQFAYQNTPGNKSYSTLSWIDNGPTCQYADVAGDVLIDAPNANFYHNGLICSQYAARVSLPRYSQAPENSPVDLPLRARDFENIYSFLLTAEYETTAMTYNGFTAHPAFGGSLAVTVTPATGTLNRLAISWTGAAPLTIPDDSALVTLHVSALTGATPLSWITTDGVSCRYGDAVGSALCDLPKNEFYTDGFLATQTAPVTIAGQASPASGQTVAVPVVVYGFRNTGYWSLTLDYDPGSLAWVSATPLATLGGTFTSAPAGTGRITLSWSGTPTTLPDSTSLVSLLFNYSSGASMLEWHDDGSSCRYAAGAGSAGFYDLPSSSYYINGYIGPSPLTAGFTAGTLLPATGQAVTFTDQSTGSPTAWSWDIQPPTFVFTGGTGASSQHPQAAFTVGGAYTVTLRVTRGTLTSVRIRTGYIHAGTPGLWTGRESGSWTEPTNWDNHLLPGSSVNVLIPTVAGGRQYPTVNGNLTLGTDCGNLRLTGTATLTVTGLLTVGAGTALELEDSATVTAGAP